MSPGLARRIPQKTGYAPLLKLAGPVVLSRLGIMAMGLVDTIVVGRYSSTELGYHALGWAPTAVVLTTSIGLLSGVQVLTSQAIGDNRAADTGAILRRGCIYAFWIGIAAAVLLAGLGGPLMHNIGLNQSLADGATPVLQIFALSLLPILVADTGIFWLEAHGRAIPGTIAMWSANIVNLVLNLWLVPGNSGLPVHGAVASGWATFASRIALLIFVWILIARWPAAKALGAFTKAPRNPVATTEMRRIGYGASASYFTETLAFAAMSIFAGWIGAVAVASWAIVLNVAALIFMIPLGLATATGVMVGRAHGARDPHGVREAAKRGFIAAVAITLLICAIVGFGNTMIAAAYTRDPAVQAMTAAALLLSCLFFVADGLQVVGAQALRAQSDIWVPTMTHFTSYLIVMMPLGWLFAIQMGHGVNGIIWAIIIASLLSAGLLWGRFLWLTQPAR
ncbi:putative multidrug resistance protein NorM [Polymorphobacter glacialis]|uniref:Multidrug resistance protein NorM n=1 Tax=Sandarakinorhabdus glacialis TaxID=1614636 RepID=A0A917E6V0_9SPHN|nr:MATE family efflux transporter [Polymorphobacter glacialis]GGE10077.1 putative multidrug resistance protein NorM [Polymorphobacter glacialis]